MVTSGCEDPRGQRRPIRSADDQRYAVSLPKRRINLRFSASTAVLFVVLSFLTRCGHCSASLAYRGAISRAVRMRAPLTHLPTIETDKTLGIDTN